MSEKSQGTAASLREKMALRYNDGLEHKHNKNHHTYRHHYRSHPANQQDDKQDTVTMEGSTGLLKEFNSRKTRKRLDKRRYH